MVKGHESIKSCRKMGLGATQAVTVTAVKVEQK